MFLHIAASDNSAWSAPLGDDGLRVTYAIGESNVNGGNVNNDSKHPFLFHNENCGSVWMPLIDSASECK